MPGPRVAGSPAMQDPSASLGSLDISSPPPPAAFADGGGEQDPSADSSADDSDVGILIVQ